MRRLRTLMLAGASTALVLTAFAAPASAAPGKGTFAVVNGIPGVRVDICINGKEIRSGLKYGGKVFRRLVAGPKVLKVRKATPGRCKGRKLAGKAFALAAGAGPALMYGADLTLVATKRAPRVIVFDNVGLGQIPPTGPDFFGTYIAWRHAADLGDANLFFDILVPDNPIAPAANPIWQEGDQTVGPVAPGQGWRLSATRPEKTHKIAESRLVMMKPGRRYEWYLVGTRPRNAKFVLFSRAVSQPTL